jgi:hypothetical protein
MAPTTRASSRTDRKNDWKSRNDRGPHTATMPSGMTLEFVLPNETELIRADMLPNRLTEIAMISAAFPGGADGYMETIAYRTVNAKPDEREAAQAHLKETVKQGLELRDWLVSHMLVDPTVTPEEVAAGDFPQADIDMLIEFAERRRNTDAAGKRLAIVVLEEFARFRDVVDGDPDREPGRSDEPVVSGADAGADGEPL